MSRPVKIPLAAIGFVLITLLLALAGLAKFHGWISQSGQWLDGSKTSAIGTAYSQHHLLRESGIGFWGTANYLLFNEGNEGLHIGSHDWLFSSEELLQSANESEQVAAAQTLITMISEQLKAKGVDLVVVMVPPKWRIVSEYLRGYAVDHQVSLRRNILMSSIASHHIPVVDALAVMKPLGERAFLKTDTHWTPAASKTVASYLAQLMKHRWSALPYGEVSYTLNDSGVIHYKGDLMNFLPLAGWLERFGPQPDKLQQFTLTEQDAADELALFSQQVFPVVLVGSSYSANSRWHFADALQVELGIELLNTAQEGKGAIAPMLDYLDSSDFRETPPEVIIWEFPERYLGVEGNVELVTKKLQKNLPLTNINKKEVVHHGLF